MAYDADDEVPPGVCAVRSNLKVGPDEEFMAANGAHIEVFRRGAAPLVNVRVMVDSPATQAVVPSLAFEQIHGRRRYAPQIGGTAQQFFDGEHLVLGENVLSGNLENALADNWEFLEDRRYYSKQNFDELKTWQLRRLDDRRGVPSRGAVEVLDARLFPGHPYGQRLDRSHYKDVSVGDVNEWTEDTLHPEAATVVIAGDVTPSAEFNAQVERRFGEWTRWGTPPRRAAWPAAPLPQSRTLDVVQRAGPLSTILVGVRLRSVDPRTSPSVDALAWLLERELDRAFQEATGIFHAVEVTRRDRSLGSSLIVRLTVESARSDWAVRTILDAFQSAAQSPRAAAVVERARIEVLRELPARFDTLDHLTRRAMDAVATYHDPLFWETYQKAIAEVNPETVLAAAKQLGVGAESVVVIGDKASVSSLP
jgi:predicted Zn-dependent peptidase